MDENGDENIYYYGIPPSSICTCGVNLGFYIEEYYNLIAEYKKGEDIDFISIFKKIKLRKMCCVNNVMNPTRLIMKNFKSSPYTDKRNQRVETKEFKDILPQVKLETIL